MPVSQLRIEPTIGKTRIGGNWNVPRPTPQTISAADRPAFLSFVAMLFLLCGIGSALLLLGNWPILAMVATDTTLVSGWPHSLATMAIVSTLAGVFLFFGGPAGWYLAMFLLIESLLAAATGWAVVRAEGSPIAFWADNSISWYAQIGLQMFLTMALVGYFFSKPVREYCAMNTSKCLMAIAIICALELAVFSVQV